MTRYLMIKSIYTKMVRRAGGPCDRNSIATVIVIEDSLIIIEQTLEIIIKTESTIF